MPETIEKRKVRTAGEATTARRRKPVQPDTGSFNIADLHPELCSAKPGSAVVKGAKVKKVATPKTGLPAVEKKAVRKPSTAVPAVRTDAAKAREEKPRIQLILGTVVGLTLVFVCMIILNASLKHSRILVQERMTEGDAVARHETWEPSNPIADVVSSDPEIAAIDIFLVQDEEEPGMVHFLIQAQRAGAAEIEIQYENKDKKVIALTVEPVADDKPAGRADKESKNQMLDKVRELVRAGDELMTDADKSVDNTAKAAASFKKALRTLRQIRLHQFLPEYKGLEEKIKAADEKTTERYKKIEAEYQVARDRDMDSKARELLKVLLQIAPDAKDPRNLMNRTYLEYVHSEG